MGLGADPDQGMYAHLRRAGFRLEHCGCDDPEAGGFDMAASIVGVEDTLRAFAPDVVVGASKGGAYLLELWRRGCKVPCVMINVHPDCRALPTDVPVVLVHGANDTTFPRERGLSPGEPPDGSLEALLRTGSRGKSLLYYAGSSGELPGGGRTRHGDAHNRSETLPHPFSLLQHDCLPRLIEVCRTHVCAW